MYFTCFAILSFALKLFYIQLFVSLNKAMLGFNRNFFQLEFQFFSMYEQFCM